MFLPIQNPTLHSQQSSAENETTLFITATKVGLQNPLDTPAITFNFTISFSKTINITHLISNNTAYFAEVTIGIACSYRFSDIARIKNITSHKLLTSSPSLKLKRKRTLHSSYHVGKWNQYRAQLSSQQLKTKTFDISDFAKSITLGKQTVQFRNNILT